jgi:hypothetical protein
VPGRATGNWGDQVKLLKENSAQRALRAWAILLVTAAFTVAAAGQWSGASAGAAPAELTVWVSPTGSDTNDGLTGATPFKSLQRANDWLCGSTTSCPGRGVPVIIRLAQRHSKVVPRAAASFRYNPADAPATTLTSTTAWHYFDPVQPTTFEPWNYRPGDSWQQVSASGGYPTFDGGFAADTGLVFTPRIAMRAGGTHLSFLYTRWQNFRISAIALNGGLVTAKTSAGIKMYAQTPFTANGVTFYGNFFFRIGNRWNSKNRLGYGAVLPNNSSANVFRNNHFVELMNTAKNSDTIHIHGLYIAHGSNASLVDGNAFQDVTGDAVRQRDRSNGTIVTHNTFTRAGAFGYMDDFYCRPNLPDTTCAPKEYRSHGGVFAGNVLHGLYPAGVTGRRTVFCHDQKAGLCPASRIAVHK